MSLLADLLSRLKPPQTTRDIPPNLRSIVQSSAQKSANRRRIFLLSVLFVVAVLAGFFLVHFIKTLSEKPAGTVSATPERTIAASNQTQTATSDINDMRKKPSTSPGEAGLKSAPVGQKEEPAGPVQLPEPARKPVRGGRSVLPDLKQVIVRKDAPVARVSTKDESAKDAYLYSARDLELKNDYQGALGHYKTVLELDNRDFTVMNNIAYLYLKMALPEEAATYARRALETKKDYVPALINLGIASAVSGDIPSAEGSFIHALKLEPDNRDALFNLALLYEKKTDYPKASEYFARLSRLGSVTGTLGLARIFEKQDNPREALKLYRSAYADLSLDDRTLTEVKKRIALLSGMIQKSGN